MSEEGRLFLEACGASGPLQLEWRDCESGEVVRRVFEHAAVLVGRNSAAHLSLDHPRVGKRHAYLQMIEGRLFAIDLESREGLRWSEVPRRSGWIERRRPVQVGPTTIRLIEGDHAEVEDPGAGPGPLSRRFAGRHNLPGIDLEIRAPEAEPTRWAMDRVITLVGSSPDCKVRLLEPDTSRFACALVRTPKGVWMVDLLSSKGVTVNGVTCRQVRLEDGDLVQIGGQSIRLTYDGPANGPRRQAAGTPALAIPTQEAWELVPDVVLGHLQGHDGPVAKGPASVDQALMMLVRLLGEMHRDHLEVVREEMEQIRRLNREMGTLRRSLPQASPPPGEAAAAKALPPNGLVEEPAPDDASRDRPAPQVVNAMVGQRLAAWEKERQSRWRKVMDLLVKP